jgi:hypothetical protein
MTQVAVLLLLAGDAWAADGQGAALPNRSTSLTFAAIGGERLAGDAG